MSMLAEKKRKQKWSLNPRGKEWSQDANKFGQKMLERMGWQHGKGLGANEDGITEHVKVSYKNDSKGMGYKETDDQWTEHENNFSALLQSLTGAAKPDGEIKVKSLEKKSQTSRVRVHYHKFTRGKDLSRYSEKDLANIFGKKSLKQVKKDEDEDPRDDSPEKESTFLRNAGSMRDYFKKKLPSFGRTNGLVVGSNGVLKKEESDSESDKRPSFSFNETEMEETQQYAGFGFKSEVTSNSDLKNNSIQQEATFVSYLNEEINATPDKKKKQKRKAEEIIVATPSPKKKSKKNVDGLNMGLSNPAFNPLRTPMKIEKHILTTIEESFSEEVSVLDGSPKYIETEAEVHEIRNTSQENCRSEGGDASQKKTKKRRLESLDQIAVEVPSSEDTNVAEFEEGWSERKSKEKKPGKRLLALDNPNFEEISEEATDQLPREENPYEIKAKKKKTRREAESSVTSTEIEENAHGKPTGRRKKKKGKITLENLAFDESAEDPADDCPSEENPYELKTKKKSTDNSILKPAENPYEVKIKKKRQSTNADDSSNEDNPQKNKKTKKKKEKLAVTNPSFDESAEDSIGLAQPEENPYEVKTKKKKAEKLAVENPAFNDTADNPINFSQAEENPFEIHVKPKKKSKKKEAFAVENPNFDPYAPTDGPVENAFEVQRKKSKKRKEESGVVNPALNLNASPAGIEGNLSTDVDTSDLMLNIVTTPVVKTKTPIVEDAYSITKVNSVKRRKSVRFSDVTQERIIPSNEDLRDLSDFEDKEGRGLDNMAFDEQRTSLEENLDCISKTIERYQAEIENDINEKKLEAFSMDDLVVGEVGNPHGDNERLPDGTRLKFKYAHLVRRTPFYQLDKTGAKKAYKHLIKGDIVVKFRNTNLHEIEGYAAKRKQALA